MQEESSELGTSNLDRARRLLLPPEGNNWGEIAHDPEAEMEFLNRVGPLLHPHYETVWRHSETGAHSETGLQATLTALRVIGREFETLVAIPELFVDLGDRVLALVRREGRSAAGVDFSEEGAAMYVFEGGLLRRMELYADRATALAEAGVTAAEAYERGVPAAGA